jgi:hypothetical protein
MSRSALRRTPKRHLELNRLKVDQVLPTPKLHGANLLRLTELAVNDEADEVPPLKGLSLLDRFLVLWIILAMAIGIILGRLVPSTGRALQKGEFVSVSIPIGA